MFKPIKTFKSIKREIISKHYRNLYRFVSSQEYSKETKRCLNHYKINNGKINVWVMKDFYICNLFENIYLYDGENSILNESFNHCCNIENCFPKQSILKKGSKIKQVDKVCQLAMDWSKNYWHLTFEILPKILMMEESGYDGKYLLFDNNDTKSMLKILGISEEKVIFYEEDYTYKVDELTVLDAAEVYGDKLVDYMDKQREQVLNKLDLSDNKNYHKRLYIKRVGIRKIKNEDELISFLKKYGFETITPEEMSVEEEIKHFYFADIVISSHGAAFTNTLYMRPKSHIIELFGKNYVNPECIIYIANKYGLNYHMCSEYSDAGKKSHVEQYSKLSSKADFEVDVRIVQNTLNCIVGTIETSNQINRKE